MSSSVNTVFRQGDWVVAREGGALYRAFEGRAWLVIRVGEGERLSLVSGEWNVSAYVAEVRLATADEIAHARGEA